MEKRKKHVPRRGYQEQSSGETHVAGREKGASGAGSFHRRSHYRKLMDLVQLRSPHLQRPKDYEIPKTSKMGTENLTESLRQVGSPVHRTADSGLYEMS